MKNKIIGIIGLLFVVFSIGSYFAYSKTIKNNSDFLGKPILVLSKDLEAGEAITKDNIVLKKTKINDLTKNYLTEDDLDKVNGKVAAINLYRNEQLTLERLTDKKAFEPETSQDIALEITSVGALSGEIRVGDFVDLWDNTGNHPVKKMSNVKLVGIKDTQNQEVEKVQGAIPSSIVIRLDSDEQVSVAKSISSLFVSKGLNQINTQLSENKK